MAQYSNDFKKYVSRIDEVGGYEARPGWLAGKLGAKKKAAANDQMVRYATQIAKYLHFDIQANEIESGLAGDYTSLRNKNDPGQQAFIQLVKSIAASKSNKPPVGLTKGQIESIMRAIDPNTLAGHVGKDSVNSPEAFAIFLGQMAQSMGGHISLEPGFQREVQQYYHHNQKRLKQAGNEQMRDTRRAGEVKRGGLKYVAGQIKQMGLADETVQDINNAITQAMSNANRAGRHEDEAALRQFIIGLAGGTP